VDRRIRIIRKISREDTAPYGKAGPHCDKRERRVNKKDTDDYLDEAEEETEEEPKEEE
jgi:hypothetical protein